MKGLTSKTFASCHGWVTDMEKANSGIAGTGTCEPGGTDKWLGPQKELLCWWSMRLR